MHQFLFFFFILGFSLLSYAQTNMRPLVELINTTESAWPTVQEWMQAANNKVQVLPADAEQAKTALYNTQVTTRSPMGAVILHTGGILIDDGWIRILGAGSPQLKRSLPAWNRGKSFTEYGEAPGFLLIADDAVGGFFLLNGGALGQDLGKVYYLSPDNLEYEPLDINYSQFLEFCFTSDLNEFYAGLRWNDWRADVQQLNADSVYGFFPYLFTKEGKDMNKNTRKIIPIEEHYNFYMSFMDGQH